MHLVNVISQNSAVRSAFFLTLNKAGIPEEGAMHGKTDKNNETFLT